jgi:hypothetical protein
MVVIVIEELKDLSKLTVDELMVPFCLMNQDSSCKKSPWKMPSRFRIPSVEEEVEAEAEVEEDEFLITLKKV